ncbi:MAG: hypothetical protein WC581_11220 [Thermodesulfovibrionales bacterium]
MLEIKSVKQLRQILSLRSEDMRGYWGIFVKGWVIFSFATFLICCGGGGGESTSRGGGRSALLTDSNAPETSDILLQAVKLVTPISSLGELKTSSVSSVATVSPLIRVAQKITAVAETIITTNVSATSLINENCSDGGHIAVDIDNIDLIKKSLDADINVASCRRGTEILNGKMKVKYKVSFGALTNPTLDDLRNFEEVTITTSGFTYSDTSNNDDIKLTDVTLVLKDFNYDGDNLKRGSITVGGAITGTVDGEIMNVKCDSFELLFTKNPSTGEAVSVSGRLYPSCLNGWIRLKTKSPVLFPPNAACPTDGDVIFSSGENTTEVIITANSEMNIYFNNIFVEMFNSCHESKGLCYRE